MICIAPAGFTLTLTLTLALTLTEVHADVLQGAGAVMERDLTVEQTLFGVPLHVFKLTVTLLFRPSQVALPLSHLRHQSLHDRFMRRRFPLTDPSARAAARMVRLCCGTL